MTTIGGSGTSCLERIALWDNGINTPFYSNNGGGQWEFIYDNGIGCTQRPATITKIFWNCNSLIPTAQIQAARNPETCEFELQVDSILACS